MRQGWLRKTCKWLLIVMTMFTLTVVGLFVIAWVGVKQLTQCLLEQDSQWTYRTWDDLSDNDLLVRLVPRSATSIKRWDIGGFKSYECNVSCSVSLQGLKAFAKQHGYLFKPMASEDAIMTGMIDQAAKGSVNYRSEGAFGKSDFLRCSFSRKTQSGMSQHFEFIYDMVHQKLYCRYSDG